MLICMTCMQLVRKQLVRSLEGQPVFNVGLKRKDKVKTLSSDANVVLRGKIGKSIDPSLFFQRMLVLSNTGDVNVKEMATSELCNFPMALFESPNMLRLANKGQLIGAIRIYVVRQGITEADADANAADSIDETFVLDDDLPLHRLEWKHNDTYGAIASTYATYTMRRYRRATVVFDRYSKSSSIKDMIQKCRESKHCKFSVNVTPATQCTLPKYIFLSNERNKEKLILLIAEQLRQHSITVLLAEDDTDADIACAAVASSQTCKTMVVGEDTDLLILLLHHGREAQFPLQIRSDIREKSEIVIHDISQ